MSGVCIHLLWNSINIEVDTGFFIIFKDYKEHILELIGFMFSFFQMMNLNSRKRLNKGIKFFSLIIFVWTVYYF